MLEKLINILFPPKCIFCREILEVSNSVEICGTCYNRIPFVSAHSSIRNTSALCDDIIYICEYTGIVKEALKRYKFNGKASYCRAFSKLLSEEVKRMTNCRNFDIIVSVPLYKAREASRGYNQARLISNILSKSTGIREASQTLVRVRDTGTQSLISTRHGRRNNVKDAFTVACPERVKGRSVILVDDILTTGSTIDECCRVLKDAGAETVIAAVIASGRKY